MKVSSAVARKLGWYVYAYVNPMDDRIFYVGKGYGRRLLAHLRATSSSAAAGPIRTLKQAGLKPRLDLLAHGISDPHTALQIEAAVIDALGMTTLSNQIRGWHAGRAPLTEIVAQYERRRIAIREPAVLIRINKLYRPGMGAAELYDATRGVWKLGDRRTRIRYAFAVFEGVVREVYEIAGWLPAGTTFSTRNPRGVASRNRWEFVGRVAEEKIRRRYIDRYVGHLFRSGAQNPIQYVNDVARPRSRRR